MNIGETPDCWAEFCQRQAGGSLRCRPTSYPDGCIHDTTRPPLNTRRARALRRTDRMKFPGPSRPYPIAEQVARVPEDVLTLVLSTLATLAAYRDALRAGREAELDGIHGAGRNTVRRHGRARLANALPVLRHFVRQGRPWDIDPYAVLRYLMPRPPEPESNLDLGPGPEETAFLTWVFDLGSRTVSEAVDWILVEEIRGTLASDVWGYTDEGGRRRGYRMTAAQKVQLLQIAEKIAPSTPSVLPAAGLEELPPVELPTAPLVLDSRPEPPPDLMPAPMPPPPVGFAELVSPKREDLERALADLMPLKTARAIAMDFANGWLGRVCGIYESIGPEGDRRPVTVGTGRRGNRKVIQFGRLDRPAPETPHENAVPEAPDASAEPEGPIYPPAAADRSGAPQRRSGRRGRTMPGQGSLFD
jgi:hypothetical protein